MQYSINNSVPFSAINWDSFENRPPMNSGPICQEKDWYEDKAKCCIGSHSINSVLEVAEEYGVSNSEEAKFLEKFPCVNGIEIDFFADMIDRLIPQSKEPVEEEIESPTFECITRPIFDGLKKILPRPILDKIEPYLCRY